MANWASVTWNLLCDKLARGIPLRHFLRKGCFCYSPLAIPESMAPPKEVLLKFDAVFRFHVNRRE